MRLKSLLQKSVPSPACAAIWVFPEPVCIATAGNKNGASASPRENALSSAYPQSGERQEVLDVLHSERFGDKAPQEVYPTLLSEGQYLAPSDMYRLLDGQEEVRERRNQTPASPYQKPECWPQIRIRSGPGIITSSWAR